jgi:hypothetical protein
MKTEIILRQTEFMVNVRFFSYVCLEINQIISSKYTWAPEDFGIQAGRERHPVIYGRSERQRTPFPARKNPHCYSAGFVIDL